MCGLAKHSNGYMCILSRAQIRWDVVGWFCCICPTQWPGSYQGWWLWWNGRYNSCPLLVTLECRLGMSLFKFPSKLPLYKRLGRSEHHLHDRLRWCHLDGKPDNDHHSIGRFVIAARRGQWQATSLQDYVACCATTLQFLFVFIVFSLAY